MKRVDIQSLPCNLKDTEVKLSRFFVAKIRIMCYRPLFIIIRATSETHMRLRCQIDCWLLSYIFWILGALHFLQEATPLSSLWGVCVATAHPVRLPSNTRTLRVWGRVCQQCCETLQQSRHNIIFIYVFWVLESPTLCFPSTAPCQRCYPSLRSRANDIFSEDWKMEQSYA